jgi:hypothetical protein
MRRSYLLVIALMLSLSIIFTPVHAASWSAEVTTLDIPPSAVYLAPDGSKFAIVTREFKEGYIVSSEELCMYSLSGELQTCTDLELPPIGYHINLETVRWSPDSTKIVFSEAYFQTGRDSDIWMLDTITNTLSDLTPTPNRNNRDLAARPKDPNLVFSVDIAPQWSTDSQYVYFLRWILQNVDQHRTALYNVNVTTDETKEIAPIETYHLGWTHDFALSPDASQVAYNKWITGDEEDEGTWFLDVGTGEAKIAEVPIKKPVPGVLQFSPDGSQVLSVQTLYFTPEPGTIGFYTLPVAGGLPRPISTDYHVTGAGWGNQGSRLGAGKGCQATCGKGTKDKLT